MKGLRRSKVLIGKASHLGFLQPGGKPGVMLWGGVQKSQFMASVQCVGHSILNTVPATWINYIFTRELAMMTKWTPKTNPPVPLEKNDHYLCKFILFQFFCRGGSCPVPTSISYGPGSRLMMHSLYLNGIKWQFIRAKRSNLSRFWVDIVFQYAVNDRMLATSAYKIATSSLPYIVEFFQIGLQDTPDFHRCQILRLHYMYQYLIDKKFLFVKETMKFQQGFHLTSLNFDRNLYFPSG